MAESRGDPALRVFRVSTSQLLVGPIRIALGAALLAPSVALGDSAAAGIAFAVGAFGLAFSALGDPRRRFLSIRGEPETLPSDAAVETPGEMARRAVFPSTVGVAVLTAVALAAGQETLAALLAGALAGLGVAAILAGLAVSLRERETGRDLYVDRRARRLYARRR